MTLKWNVLADTAATDVAIAASASRSITNTFMPLSMKMNCLINWMTGINLLNIFVNFSDKILPHVPTWRRNWSWFRCEPALFCSCSRLAGGIFWRKGTAVGWRQETPSANESVVSTTAFRKILAFFEKNWVCWAECKILTFRSHSPQKSAEKTEHCRSLCNEYSHKTVTRALRLWGLRDSGFHWHFAHFLAF